MKNRPLMHVLWAAMLAIALLTPLAGAADRVPERPAATPGDHQDDTAIAFEVADSTEASSSSNVITCSSTIHVPQLCWEVWVCLDCDPGVPSCRELTYIMPLPACS